MVAKRRKKVVWNFGDVFLIPLNNGKYLCGQVLDLQYPNTVRIALYDELIDSLAAIDINSSCETENLISLIACSREQLDYAVWEVVGSRKIQIPQKIFPNEKFRKNKWVGSTTYDAEIVDELANAYYALLPWDDFYDSQFLDKLLVNKNSKPSNLIYIKK